MGDGILGVVIAIGFTLFDTAIGPCGIAWSARGVVGVQLPEADRAATASRLAHVFAPATEQPAPPAIETAIEGIRRHLDGSQDDLRWIDLDLDRLTEFDRSVYNVTRAIDPGHTLTYGEVADQVAQRGAAQAVGQALGRNPIPLIVPCHRVLAAGNRVGGFTAYGSTVTKRSLLAIEHAPGFDTPTLF